MKKNNLFLSLPLIAAVLLLGSFAPLKKPTAAIINYAWYTPDNQFVAWSTLVNAEVVSGDNTDPNGGTLALEGYTDGGPNQPPSGTLVYKLYSH